MTSRPPSRRGTWWGELKADGFGVFRLGEGTLQPIIALLLAPLVCSEFQPELWLVGEAFVEEAGPAPFPVPDGLQAVQLQAAWAPVTDFILKARRGPGLRASFPNNDHFLVVRAEQGGSYILFQAP